MKMRTACLLVVGAWMSLLIAPDWVVAQESPGVEVTEVQWIHDVNRKNRVKGYYGRSPAPSPDFIQEVSAVFRNVGAKPVKSVKWEYVVYQDSDSAKVARVYEFRSKALLRPGESARLRKQGINIQHRKHFEARVVRVEYADGTVWQRAKG